MDFTTASIEEPTTILRTSSSKVPANHQLIIGDWIAQWDTKYRAGYFYNINTETSTWIKPAELDCVSIKPPESEENLNQVKIKTKQAYNTPNTLVPYKPLLKPLSHGTNSILSHLLKLKL